MEVERYFILEFSKINLYLKALRPIDRPWAGEGWSSELADAFRFDSRKEATEAILKLDNPDQVFVRTVEEETPEDGERLDTADCDVMVLDKEIGVYLTDAPALGGKENWESNKSRAYMFDSIDDAEEAVRSLNRQVFRITYELKAKKEQKVNRLFSINITYNEKDTALLHWSGTNAIEMINRAFHLARVSKKEPRLLTVTSRGDI